MAHLAGWNQLRRDRAVHYNSLLAENETVVCRTSRRGREPCITFMSSARRIAMD
jgi:hypothetical protein